MHKDTTTTTIRISNDTLRVLDEWADLYEISRADAVRCVLGFFTTLQPPAQGTPLSNDYPYKAIAQRMQVLAESQ